MDAAVVACFLLDHDTAPPYMVTTHPVVFRRVSLHAAKLALYQNPSGCLFPPNAIPGLQFLLRTAPRPPTRHGAGKLAPMNTARLGLAWPQGAV
jgi:hypothetical protein